MTAAAAALPDEVPAEEIKRRVDLRGIQVVTIDPVNAKDFDDALSLTVREDGDLELGVHIADVSHYVRFDDPIDREAWQRGTSVYLVDRVLPMLPEKLSNQLCSLNPNVDRLAMSVLIHSHRARPHHGLPHRRHGDPLDAPADLRGGAGLLRRRSRDAPAAGAHRRPSWTVSGRWQRS